MSAQGQVTYQTAVNLGDLVADGIYPIVLAPQAVLPAGPNTSYSGVIGTFAWGKPGVPLVNSAGGPVATPADLYDAAGIPSPTNPYDGGSCILLAMGVDQNSSGTFAPVRATDGTDVAAQIPIQDSGTSAGASVTIAGTPTHGDIAGLTFNPPTNTLTVTGTPAAADTIVYTIKNTLGVQIATGTYTVSGTPTTSAAATAAATAFNASALAPFVFALAIGSTVVFYSIQGVFYTATVAVTPGGGGHIGASLNSPAFQQVSATLPPVNVTATAPGTSVGPLSKRLQQAINASNAVLGPTAFLAAINVNNLGTFAMTSILPGTAGNNIVMIGYVSSGATATISPVIPTNFTGGGVQGTLFVVNGICTGSRANGGQAFVNPSAGYNPAQAPSSTNLPTYDLTLTMPNAPAQETFRNIAAWVLTSNVYTFDAPTFTINALAAVNTGIPNGRGPSRYWVAAAYGGSPSTLVPWTQGPNNVATIGTDGASGVNISNLIGTDGLTAASRTGMYGLRGTGVFQFAIAGMGQNIADLGASQACYAFALSELSFFAGPTFPIGTDTQTAINDRAQFNLIDIYGENVKDWVYYFDSFAGQIIAKDPTGIALGVMASINPAENPGNKPETGIKGILYTERTQVGPYSTAEAGSLAQAGITAPAQYVLSPLFTMINGQNAAGSTAPGQGSVNYTRLTNYILRRLFQIFAPLVDKLQGTAPNDPTRILAKNKADALGQQLMGAGQVVSWQTVCDGTNNTPVTISQGLLLCYIVAEYYGIARFIVPTLLGGTNVAITTVQQQLAA